MFCLEQKESGGGAPRGSTKNEPPPRRRHCLSPFLPRSDGWNAAAHHFHPCKVCGEAQADNSVGSLLVLRWGLRMVGRLDLRLMMDLAEQDHWAATAHGFPEFPHGVASARAPGRGFDGGLGDFPTAVGGLAESHDHPSTTRRKQYSSTFCFGQRQQHGPSPRRLSVEPWTGGSWHSPGLRCACQAQRTGQQCHHHFSPLFCEVPGTQAGRAYGGRGMAASTLAKTGNVGQATPPQSTRTATRHHAARLRKQREEAFLAP